MRVLFVLNTPQSNTRLTNCLLLNVCLHLISNYRLINILSWLSCQFFSIQSYILVALHKKSGRGHTMRVVIPVTFLSLQFAKLMLRAYCILIKICVYCVILLPLFISSTGTWGLVEGVTWMWNLHDHQPHYLKSFLPIGTDTL